jgi:SAM-dependent MidA family methyltransferase
VSPGGESAPSPTAAEREIRRRIAERGSISFAEFMELALYWPEGGYYTRPGATTGPEGDFLTASDTSPAFGETLARPIAAVWESLGRPEPFEIVEAGPGRGLLAADLLTGLAEVAPELHAILTLTLDEVSPVLRAAQRERLAPLLPAGRLRWEEGGLPARGERSWTGVLVANELLDALPVHRIRRRGPDLRELHVGLDEKGSLMELEVAPDEEVLRFAEGLSAAPADGDEAEAGLAAARWVEAAARGLDRGLLLFIDYGHEARELYSPAHRRGSLLAYHHHRVGEDLLARVGRQDLTAHVSWTAVDEAAARGGLDGPYRTTQDRFLLALGLGDRFRDLSEAARAGDQSALREQLALKSLILPEGMGRRFQVSAYGRGLEDAPPGFEDPFEAPPPDAPSGEGPVTPPKRRVRLVR